MLRVTTEDGDVFEGDSEKEIVVQMRNTQWGAPVVKREYMRDVVERVENMTGVMMDPEASLDDDRQIGADEFLTYLQAVNLVKVERA